MASVTLNPTSLPGVKRIIAVMSGKGGVGKTFVTVNLALSLAKNGLKIGILDADIPYSNVFHFLGINTKLTPNADGKLVPIEKWGLKVVAMDGLAASEDEPMAWRGTIVTKVMQQLARETLWGQLDILFIDFPSGICDSSLTLLQHFAIDNIIVVTSPQQLATRNAARTIMIANTFKIPVVGIVENMRGETFGEGGGSKLGQKYMIPTLGSIPLKKGIVRQCDSGRPTIFESEELDMVFFKIGRQLVEEKGN